MYNTFSDVMQLVIFKASYSRVDQLLSAFLPVITLELDNKVLRSFIIQWKVQSLISPAFLTKVPKPSTA